MTKYELYATVMSSLAILIPFVKFLIDKYIIKSKLKFYETGKAYLFTNISGSYIRLEGVYEAVNKAASVKNIELKIKRKKDDKMLNLRWSVFNSPINQNIVGVYTMTSEIAHPFKIESDSVSCAFVEFEELYNSAYRANVATFEELKKQANTLLAKYGSMSDRIKEEYIASPAYNTARSALIKELFWEIGDYEAEMIVSYNSKQTCKFKFSFGVHQEHYEDLLWNIDVVLMSNYNNIMRIPVNARSVCVDIKQI